jgi:hypothetical protein
VALAILVICSHAIVWHFASQTSAKAPSEGGWPPNYKVVEVSHYLRGKLKTVVENEHCAINYFENSIWRLVCEDDGKICPQGTIIVPNRPVKISTYRLQYNCSITSNIIDFDIAIPHEDHCHCVSIHSTEASIERAEPNVTWFLEHKHKPLN